MTRLLGLVAVLLPSALSTAVSADVLPEAHEIPFELIGTEVLSERLLEHSFESPAADGGTTSVRVLLPDGYDPTGATRYPVLYLLHGGGDDEDAWTVKGAAEAATAGLPLIVVMPSVLGHGNYVDWYNHGRGGAPMWESLIIGRLLPWIDETYPTVGQRHGRAVAGLSMGGGGSMGFASHHPDLFVSAAAFSGAVDLNTIPVQVLANTSGLEHGHEPAAVHGVRLTEEVRWRNNNPWDLAANLRTVDVFLATGNGLPGGPGGEMYPDPVEQQCWEMMRNLHDRLAAFGIEHHWDDYGAGAHSWFYWQRELRNYLTHVMPIFAEERPAPDVIDHTSANPEFRAFGWDVALERPAMEFSTLAGAGPDGFELRGTGTATVVTPPRYQPGEQLVATVTDAAGRSSSTLTADTAGRLTVPVDLGPGNPYQQYRIEALAWAASQPGGVWPVRTAAVTITPADVTAPAEPAAPVPESVAAGVTGRLPATGGPNRGVVLVGGLALVAAFALRRLHQAVR